MDLDLYGQVDQEDLESQLISQASSALAARENELDEKRLEKTRKALEKAESHLSVLRRKISDPRTLISQKERLRNETAKLESTELAQLRKDERDILDRMASREKPDADTSNPSSGRLADESEHDFLVRTGKITPFAGTNEAVHAEAGDDGVDDHRDLSKPAQRDESALLSRDDGIRSEYKLRVRNWEKKQTGDIASVEIDSSRGLRIPEEIWKRLFGYQRTGVRWLWELYSQKVGGIVGDEMGLGKTVQVTAFLAALDFSKKLTQPVIIVCPATVLDQWVSEFHQWWPPLRVAILHSIGAGMNGKSQSHSDSESELEDEPRVSTSNAARLIADVFQTGGVILTTYSGVKIYEPLLVKHTWGYACLDEGHKIRNPDSEVSLACKQIKTPYRLILSGTPIQNNLTELWSLFDFIFPGRLGTLPVFQTQFSVPINIGGYANATNIQVQTAYKCAVVLRDMIAPYMLRRMKSDVAADLPKKTEKVLFCKLTRPQKQKYVEFLKSEELQSIMKGKRQVLFGVDILRKICNHPDLILQDHEKHDYGDPSKSGKMQVVMALFELWRSQGNRALLFSQTRQMLDILEIMVQQMRLKYLRMDGSTAISQRQQLVDTFNKDTSYNVFLLTTKVGGLGVNLTGANRVIIYDPDWNPSTDVQARERAWRLGQQSEVMIYRLMIAGSIEEKIYQRQIFKQFLTNKILQDPKQKRFFKTTDLHDLFTLGSGTESTDIFQDQGSSSKAPSPSPQARKREREPEGDDLSSLTGLSKATDFQGGEEAPKSEENSLLEGLFAKAGVQSTLEHDAVINTSRPDTVIMEKEAQRIAHQATQALKESRKETRKAKIGTPTWTGKSGLAGRLKRKREQTESPANEQSTSILKGLRQKRALQSKPSVSESVSRHAETMRSIRKFLEARSPPAASSAEIVDACRIKLDGPQEVSNLREMLRRIAVWEDRKWVLKQEPAEKADEKQHNMAETSAKTEVQ